ncbi:MAG: YceI family protein [Myxococcota bacterium]
MRFGQKAMLLGMASLWVLPAWGGGNHVAAKQDKETWKVDTAHSNISFSIKHLGMTEVSGSFSRITGTMSLNLKNINKSKVNISIPTAALSTNNEKRDQHLRNPDFFNVEKYPTITFKSTEVTQLKPGDKQSPGGNEFNVCGILEIRGVQKKECFVGQLLGPVINPMTGAHVRTFKTIKPDSISRKAYGIGVKFPDRAGESFSEKMLSFATKAASTLIGDKVDFKINVALIKQQDSAKKKG